MEQPVSTVPPVRREILVDADLVTAFEIFTDGIGRWWPLEKLSVGGEGATVAFTGGQIVESTGDGQRVVWGTVTRWDPPDAVAFTWHPGQDADRASHVEVTFAAAAAQTLVRVEHSGWETFADPAAARAEYDHGWPMVLDGYREHVAGRADDSASEDSEDDTWVALMHRPGPTAPDGPVTDDPRFAEHAAFLGRMQEAGYLVAAGPLTGTDGEGMTILRLPGPGQLEHATRLATHDDKSVATGFFAVTVRPWKVIMHV
jgi:uncharacterized protein YciI